MKYKVYRFRSRRKDERGTFNIYAWLSIDPRGGINPKALLGQVKARTPEEAKTTAERKGWGKKEVLFAEEQLPKSRLIEISEGEDGQTVSTETPEE